MGSADKVDIVLLEELLDDGLTEGVGNASIVLTPARLTLLGVGPEQVAEESILRNLSWACYLLELCHSDELWRQAAVHTQDLIIDESGNGHAIKDVLELFPDANGVATLAFIIETIDTVDLAALVVASQEEEVLLKLDFICEEQDDGLKGVLSSVDIVTEE